MTRSRPVRALLLAGVLLFTTASCDFLTSPPDPPSAPTAFDASASSIAEIRLSWSGGAERAERIEIERAPASGSFSALTTVQGSTTSYLDPGLGPSTPYRYRIRACNEGGCSPYAGPRRARTLALLEVTTATLPDGVRGAPYETPLEVTGGDGGYSWDARGGVPAGLSLTSGGVLSGTPEETGSFQVSVVVSSTDGQSEDVALDLAIWPPLVMQTPELAPGVRGRPYEERLEASGGSGEYHWSVEGGELPDGLSLVPDGTISGTPGSAGRQGFTVRVASSDGQTAAVALTLTVHPPLEATTTSLPDGTVGEGYSQALTASGGDESYRWSVEEGALPSGLTLLEVGVVSGTPDQEGSESFVVSVTSGDGQTAEAELTLTVQAADGGGETTPVVVQTPLLPPGLVGGRYAVDLDATGGDGASYAWSVAAGALPAGLTLRADGRIEGAPTTVETREFTVEVTSGGRSAEATFALRVVANDGSRYDLTVMRVSDVPGSIEPHLRAALDRWETVVTGDLQPIQIPSSFFGSTGCGGFGELVNGTSVDDHVILVNIGSIDGEGGILGQAGPCAFRTSNTLPVVAILTLDRDDLEPLVGTSTLTDLVFHEIGHTLGFGILWEHFGYVTGSGTADPLYTGSEAVARFEAIGGTGDIPLEDDGGQGTAEAHWEEDVFDTEIMTGFSEQVGTSQPLSTMTIGSILDLGYQVSFDADDDFELPGPAGVAGAADAGNLGYDVIYRGPVRFLPDEPQGGSSDAGGGGG